MNIAWKYYEEMTKVFKIAPDNFTYSILVNGIKTNHSNRDELLKAIQLLEDIQEDGSFKADEILYNSLIDACVKFNEINKSLQLFEEMKRKLIEPSSVTYGILIKAYGKQNELGQAFRIFEEMKTKRVSVNDVTYGCLVDACVKNDRLD
jgi:pentatricopeptide repeat protein